MHVLLSHVVLTLLNPFIISRQENSISLTVILRFDYKSFGPLAIKLVFKVFSLTRRVVLGSAFLELGQWYRRVVPKLVL